jgi:hypothetical protein
MEIDLDVHVDVFYYSSYVVEGEGIVTFQIMSGGSLDAQDVIYILSLKKNFLSISAMEDTGFVVTFQRG